MEHLTKEEIQKQIEIYKKQHEEITANANACFGAIKALEALIAEKTELK